MARTRSVARALAIVAPGLLVAAGCASDREASSAPPSTGAGAGSVGRAPPTSANTVVDVDLVAMIGDSITVGSEDELRAAFESVGYPDVEIDAESGRRMVSTGAVSSGLDGVAEVLEAGELPDLWVIALGSNDIGAYRPEEFPAVIGELLAAVPADAPVVWVDCYVSNYEGESAAFGASLREVLAERGNATVVDWATVAHQDGVLTDNVHPSGFGRAEFARRVIAGVTTWTT